ncbi:hypothetical protein HNP38_000474 [Chryseobacterium defluvii]|uniref:Uncharacterized protein n=1 Tax=Chryseobacterium defluvii TaxID=160396 RepID=A0A840KE29_9FLAO|nr:hypothetical protein [Chryseobacterium defluvii]MBB4805202.1 hypothetical protein [Chryseobacterium defluvii]
MINFRLRDFVDDNIQDFNPDNPQDVIKAEKLLKAESRLNNNFSINEIEAFLDHVKNQKENFDRILKLPVIKSIYTDSYPENIKQKPNLKGIPENEIEAFREVFTPYLKEFISVSVRHNKWQDLIWFQQFYPSFFSADSLDFYKNLIHDKNYIIIDGISKYKNLFSFRDSYPFSIDKKYYYLQSLIDDFEFDEEILMINNAVAANQMTSIDNKIVLGEILSALCAFTSSNNTTRDVLRNNQSTAENWKSQKSGFFSGIAYRIAMFFSKNQNEGLILFLSSLILGVYALSFVYVFSFGMTAFLFYILANVLVIYLARRNFRYYFSSFDFKNKTDLIGKVSATLLITMVVGWPLILLVGWGSLYIYESLSAGKFPTHIILPAAILAGKFLFNKKN